jgi:hypothetical protein
MSNVPEWPQLHNPPLINVRSDFNLMLGLFRNRRFREEFNGFRGGPVPIRTHNYTWHGSAGTLLSHLLRDAVVGVETSVPAAVRDLCIEQKAMTAEVRDALRDPFTLKKGRGTADKVYNELPALVDRAHSMSVQDQQLWLSVSEFYRKVRNPLFHASQIADTEVERFVACLELIWNIYCWLNEWYPVEKLLQGPVLWPPEVAERLKSIPDFDDQTINQLAPKFAMDSEYRADAANLPSGLDLICVATVDGIYVPSSELVHLSMMSEGGRRLQMELSPNSAVRLLAFLAHAQKARGWALPDRL